MTDLHFLIPLFSACVLLFIFSFVFGQRQKSDARTAFLVYSGGFSVACFIEFTLYLPIPREIALILTKSAILILVLVNISTIYLAYAVARKKHDKIIRFFLMYSVMLCVFTLIFPHYQIISHDDLNKNGLAPTPYFLLLTLFLTIIPLYTMGILYKGWKKALSKSGRKQMKTLFWGVLFSTVYGFFVLTIVPLFVKIEILYDTSSLSVVIYAISVYWAMMRYGLIVVDITRIKEVSHILFRNMSEGVIIADCEGTIIQMNTAASDLLPDFPGIKKIQSLDTVFTDLDFSTRFSSKKSRFQIDSDERFAVVSHTSINEKNRTLGSLTLFRDITDQQKFEEVNSWKNKLESIGMLAGGVAHDFNNQLTGIIGCADLLRETLSDDEVNAQLIKTILKAAMQSAQLTSQLLAFSRKGKYRNKSMYVNELLNDVIVILQHSLDKRITVDRHFTDKAAIVSGDPDQLHNIFLNIALNARDAMPEGGSLTFTTKTVSFSHTIAEHLLSEEKPAASYVKISIKDTGTGIPEEIQKKIYEPFFTTKEKWKGCGMGLAAVYGSIQAHSGAIQLKSTTGIGSEFIIHLPNMTETPIEVNKAEEIHVIENSRHILVIEDEEVVARSTESILRKFGYSVTICLNAVEALKQYRTSWTKTDLIILDLVLPDRNGYETYAALKEINPDLIVLFCSGYSHDSQKEILLNDNAVDFLQKPYRKDDLLRKITSLI